MEKYIKGILLSGREEPKVMKVRSTLEAFYKVLDCDLIEIIRRRTDSGFCASYDEINITIICDEEGLIKGRFIAPSGFLVDKKDGTFKEVLLGKIFICDEDEEGNIISLSEEKIAKVMKSIRKANFDDCEYLEDNYGNTLVPSDSALFYSIS